MPFRKPISLDNVEASHAKHIEYSVPNLWYNDNYNELTGLLWNNEICGLQ